jgi:hypothetical protein
MFTHGDRDLLKVQPEMDDGKDPRSVQRHESIVDEFPTTVGRLQIAVHEQCHPDVCHVIAGWLNIWHQDALVGGSLNPWEEVADPSQAYILKFHRRTNRLRIEVSIAGEAQLSGAHFQPRPHISMSDDDRVLIV